MVIGRAKEQQELINLLTAEEPQFCAVYGRRRVGKTYLIRETFSHKFTFQHTGLANAGKGDQLREFRESLRLAGMKKVSIPHTWYEAFHLLEEYLSSLPKGKKLIFIDELSWMDTPHSNFISALEHFWNGWVTARKEKDIILIVCGSATSWIINKVINDHGGLHNRITKKIYLQPFTLRECEEYSKGLHLQLGRKEIAELYMVLGGVPYYWSFLRKDESATQAVDRLFFAEDAPLGNEFDSLYASLYKNAESHITIINALSAKKSGMQRNEILKVTKMSDNSTFSKALEELEQCSFIRRYYSIGKKERNAVYQLMDNLTLFHNQFIKTNIRHDVHFWSHSRGTSLCHTWSGLAFERLVLWHLPQVTKALGINGIATSAHSWTQKGDDSMEGTQIDLLIDRNDNTINICEIKYAKEEYRISKEENERMLRHVMLLREATKTRKSIHLTLISPFGAVRNEYWNDIQSEVGLDDLFA